MQIENRNIYRIRQVVCAILGICASLMLTTAIMNRQEVIAARRLSDAQAELADEVFRFHVLANSDSEKDQELKLEVRDAILLYMKGSMPKGHETIRVDKYQTKGQQAERLKEVKLWTSKHLKEIECIAEMTIREEGYDYQVNAQILKCYFPDRRYGDVLFPKGYYEALRVEIGEAAGHNWWCVLYPSLCFTDVACAVVTDEGKQELKGVLSEDTYEEVTATSTNFKIKSFFYELFKERTERQMEDGQ